MALNSERDVAILSDVVRERLTTVDIVHTRYFGGATPDAARKVLDRLVADEWLRRIPLHGQVPCYILTFAATYRLRIHRVAAKVPGLPALCRAYALVRFAVRTGAKRVPHAEWVGLFPELHRSGLPANSYFLEDAPGGPRVLLLHVDAGQDVRRAIARVRRMISRRYAIPAFAELIQSGRFEVVVLTPTEGKKRVLEKAIERRYRGLTRVRVVVIPELEPLVARKLDRRGR
jgi:hypothetical protein